MRSRTSGLRASICLATAALFAGLAAADGPAFQYRFGPQIIPAATPDEPIAPRFSSQQAKTHLETGVALWAARQQCVSCHTHGLYMITRPQLSRQWGPPDSATRDFVVAEFEKLRESDERYDSVPVQAAYLARGLASWDSGLRNRTSKETDAALRFVFEMQARDGSIRAKDRWPPLNATTYHGTAMLAMAAADAPGWLAALTDQGLLAQVDRLHTFLRETPPTNDHERLLLLWTATYQPDLLTETRKAELMESLWRQQRPDGGWTIWTFATPATYGGGRGARRIATEPDYTTPASDGYQTGVAVVVLRDAGVPAEDPRLQKAVRWLLNNQRASGRWWTRSLNVSSRFHFVSFSGTAYAVLALAKCDALPEVTEALPGQEK